ncbi:hypothetical protein ACIQV3_39695 [Streptomyces sp. NPDC099050]
MSGEWRVRGVVLTPPFEPMLAQAADHVAGSGVLASGFAAE